MSYTYDFFIQYLEDFYFLDLTISTEPFYLLFQPFSRLPILSFSYYVLLVILCVVQLRYLHLLLSVSFFIFFPLYCSFFSFSVSLICCSFSASWGMYWLISSLQLCHSFALFCRYICLEKVPMTCSGSVYNFHKLQKILLHLLWQIPEVGGQNCREFLTRPR